MEKGTSLFVDVLTLKPQRTVGEAQAYFDKIAPIAARHGLHRVTAIAIDRKMRGHEAVNPHLVQLWRVDGGTAFAELAGDPDYRSVIPERDALFDMPNLQGWFGAVT